LSLRNGILVDLNNFQFRLWLFPHLASLSRPVLTDRKDATVMERNASNLLKPYPRFAVHGISAAFTLKWSFLCSLRIMVSWKGIYFILFLFAGSFFGSIFMLGPIIPLMFINLSWYRWISSRLVATWLTLPVALLETMFGVKVVITGDAFVPGERSIIIMNHRTRVDWMFLWNCLMRYSYLRLEKICLKSSLKSVPGFGWAMQAAAFIFIHRKWKDDKSHFEDMIDYFCDIREPLQLLIFPEGTDLTENNKARSNDFAEKNGLQKYEYVLHPRTTGFTFVVDRLREAIEDLVSSWSQELALHVLSRT
ncbi:hypothetical protein STEG23_005522, partial [Scotinomys teguina]